MFSWRNDQHKADGEEIRSNFEKLAVDAGYSGTFSPFEGDAGDDMSWIQDNSVAYGETGEAVPVVMGEAVDRAEMVGDAGALDASMVRTKPAFKSPTRRESASSAMSLDIPLEVASEPRFKRALFGGFKKSSVMDYVYKVKSNMTSMKDSYERQFRDIAGERAQLSRECNLLHDQVQGYEEKARTLDEAMEEKQLEIDSKQRQIDEAKRLNDEINAKLEEKETELETMNTKMQESEKQLLNMRATVSQLSNEIDEHAALCEKLEKNIQERDVQLASLQQIIQNLRVESSSLTSRNEALANTVNKLEHERGQIATLLGLQYGTPKAQSNGNAEA